MAVLAVSLFENACSKGVVDPNRPLKKIKIKKIVKIWYGRAMGNGQGCGMQSAEVAECFTT